MPIVAVLFAAVLLAGAPRYGYHRDELYFLAAGRHLSWGYPDQPPLTPLVARIMASIDPDSLLLLRLPAVLAATLVVVCAGLMAREFGGGRAARAVAAAAVASAALTMGAGHLLSTAVFDLAAWSVVSLIVLKLINGQADQARPGLGGARWWLVIGLVVGVGLQNKLLLIFPVVALTVSLLAIGPRKVFATKYFPLAVGLAALIWLPYLVWQGRNGWPQWEMSRAIAGGSSGTSDSPIMFVLLQFGLMGPLLVPLWAFGLWRLARDPRYRAFAAAYGLLFVLFLVTGGKAYYLGGMYPILLAAAAVPLAAWLGRKRARWAVVSFVVAVNALVSAVLFLPVLPLSVLKDSPVLAINYDAGETIGWPEFARRVGEARAGLGGDVAILTANYGEAGAIERFGAPYNLPTPHSGHNSYWWWGPPSDAATEVLTVGIDRDHLVRVCADVQPAGHIDNGRGIDNDEQGAPLFVCRKPRAPWSELWPRVKHLG
ncbi:dolichyl-phosphate-mannose-protein mannosyltransferase [Nocardia tenerifensis]|uniref:Dolichyl-phosphate-mannose-protein mannosyltransferase n=1 Tax=Nocardia tenerifensis TaxID=228006 RepID=A0A318KC96_9NOCA|nr:glycosyltransferase family 39 protein [Nocardia tenerifensis]PXX69146.1 dolichyl-phosphate-mannose-protein mannosyltransferase [Nocardia tenerifensis]